MQGTQTRTHFQTQTRASHTPFLPDSVRACASLRGSALHFLLLDGGGHDIALRDLLCDVAYGGGAVRHEDGAGARGATDGVERVKVLRGKHQIEHLTRVDVADVRLSSGRGCHERRGGGGEVGGPHWRHASAQRVAGETMHTGTLARWHK